MADRSGEFEGGNRGAESAIDARSIFGGNDGGDGGGGDHGSGSGSGSDPDAPYGRFANGNPRKRPGKGGGKPAGRPPAKASKAAPDLNALTGVLVSVHFALASVAKTPELALAEKEAAMIAEAANGLLAEYGGEMDPKAIAWANFIMACGAVYGPRVIAIGVRTQNERKKKPSGEQASASA